MNVREEDRQKNSCPSRGLGLAAAAIGVGVGAALYYFFSKSPENPDGEGSTTGWNTEQPHALTPLHDSDYHITISDDSYTTISEHSTTDTSIQESHEDSDMDSNSDSNESDWMDFDSDESNENSNFNVVIQLDQSNFVDSMDLESSGSDIGTEWDVTDSSTDLPEETRSPMMLFLNRLRNSTPRRERNRERTWSLEECSICFEVILKDQKVTTLPCTHHFHSECITPWLQEQQTCPNCRKAAE